MSLKNSSNICVFCNRSNSSRISLKDESENVRQFIRLLQRFTGNAPKEKPTMIEKLLKSQFCNLLNICEECNSVVDQFSELYHKLKLVEMQLDGKLDVLLKVIKLGSRVPSRVMTLIGMLKETCKNDELIVFEGRNLIDSFRESIVQTGQQKLKLSTPRVGLRQEPFNKNARQNSCISFLMEDVQIITDDTNTDCQDSLIIGNNNTTAIVSNQNVSLPKTVSGNFGQMINCSNFSDRNIEVAPPNDSFLEPDDILPKLNDVDQIWSGDSDIAQQEDQESCFRKNDETFEESVTRRAFMVPEISELTPQIQNTSPPLSPYNIENVPSTNIFETNSSSSSHSSTPNNIQVEYAEMSIPIVKTEGATSNLTWKERVLANNEQSNPKQTSINPVSSLHNQRYNLRNKCKPKLKIAEETSSDDDYNRDDEFRAECQSGHSSSSETTSESDDIDNDVKLLKQTMADNICLATSKSSKIKRKRKKPLKSNEDRSSSKIGSGQERKSKTFKCYSDSCIKVFHCEQMYQNHKKLHEHGEFQCSFCNMKETNLVRLSTHEYKSHTAKETQTEDLRDRKRLKGHRWTCPRCFEKYDRVVDYQAHFAYSHFNIGTDPRNLKVPSAVKYTKRLPEKLELEKINGISGYRCSICKIMFPTIRTIRRHILKTHRYPEVPPNENGNKISKAKPSKSSEEIFHCHFCKVTFEYAPDLAIHEIKHATQIFTQEGKQKQNNAAGKKFQYPRCPYKYNLQSCYIKHHLTTHLNILANNLPGACAMCSGGKIFIPNSVTHFDRFHNKSLLDEPSQISECDECSAYFLQPFQLFMHKRKIHRENINKCAFCEKIFGKKDALKVHMSNVHKYSDEDPKLPFACDVKACKKRFGSLGELDLHKRFHRNITVGKQRSIGDSITCEVCAKVCKSKAALSIHKHKMHSKLKFVCAECGKSFKSKPILEIHMLYHQGPDKWDFECSECGKKCTTKYKLGEHLRTHTMEKPFVCQFCGLKYAHRHNWRNHLKTRHWNEEGAQEDINGVISKAQGASFMSRKGSKKGDCIIAGKSVKV